LQLQNKPYPTTESHILNIKIEKTDKALSVNGGLPLLEKLLHRTELDAQIPPHLPQMKIAKPRVISKFHGCSLALLQVLCA
jgi:hypothetical protein